jgi:chromatin remodeling complex protein RSC6
MELDNRFNTINDTLTLFKMQINEIQKLVKSLEKDVKKELKHKQDKDNMKKRIPSGFAKPCKVSDKLCEFINIPYDSEIARTEVTKLLNQYIKDNKLKNSKNKIVPDDKLKNLLEIQDETELENLSFFNIQKYMNKHFYHQKNNYV